MMVVGGGGSCTGDLPCLALAGDWRSLPLCVFSMCWLALFASFACFFLCWLALFASLFCVFSLFAFRNCFCFVFCFSFFVFCFLFLKFVRVFVCLFVGCVFTPNISLEVSSVLRVATLEAIYHVQQSIG